MPDEDGDAQQQLGGEGGPTLMTKAARFSDRESASGKE